MAAVSGVGILSMVGTPIGNLADASPRVVETLSSASLLLCEDTRVTSRLLAHFGVHVPLMRADENVLSERIPVVLGRIEAGERVEVEKVDLDLSDLVDGETLLFDSVALERNCAFDCEIEAGLHTLANEKQVKKMVSTLVENAFKYVDDGGSVSVSLRRAGKTAQLAISNTGSVIAPDDLPHIFDRFYRTDKARTSGAGGFGLGLAIAREIAREHGGDITCTSSEPAGTTFTVTLPIA